jgi:hypothetical protein
MNARISIQVSADTDCGTKTRRYDFSNFCLTFIANYETLDKDERSADDGRNQENSQKIDKTLSSARRLVLLHSLQTRNPGEGRGPSIISTIGGYTSRYTTAKHTDGA